LPCRHSLPPHNHTRPPQTLQSIALLYTLLRQGLKPGIPAARKAIVVCPTSLVTNWDQEIGKWLGKRLQCVALSESSRQAVIEGIDSFKNKAQYEVLIISYETFRLHSERLLDPKCCQLVICDEAHRLKNQNTLTTQTLASLPCRRRVLLSGTPMQNDLGEFFAMADFTNPGLFGVEKMFRRNFERHILVGREPDATDKEIAKAHEVQAALSILVNKFVIRRTNTLLSDHLPPKMTFIVCCKLTALQQNLYNHFVSSKDVQRVLSGRETRVLSSIDALKKLCNHPKLIYDSWRASRGSGKSNDDKSGAAHGFEGCETYFPSSFSERGGGLVRPELSGKMAVLDRLLHNCYQNTDDKFVLVSNYTQARARVVCTKRCGSKRTW
jgi:DNA repair and recombination RAD54-like protein